MDRERAGVDVTDRVDQADHPTGTAQVQPGQRLAIAGEVEERVAGQHVLAVRDQPVVELALLLGGRVQLVPHVGAATGWAQPGDAQLRAEAVGDRLELVELVDVVPRHDDRDLEPGEAGIGEMLHRPQGGVVRPGATHRVVDLGGRAVEGDLHVDVVTAASRRDRSE